MNKLLTTFLVAVAMVALLIACKKEKATLDTPPMSDYFPLEVGKTYLYRLDSTLTNTPVCPHGSCLEAHSYLAKDSIESTFSDNEGRLSYRIFRFVRDTAGTQPWQFSSTFFATPTNEWIEYVDNNFRFIKLHAPIRDGYQWKGNSFIDTKSLSSTVPYLDEWNYEYQNTGGSYDVLNKTYDNTVTILQQDETTPDGPFDPHNYQQRNYGIEVYAKGVGMIYKEFLHWTWQTTPAPEHYEDGSYGVKLQLIQ